MNYPGRVFLTVLLLIVLIASAVAVEPGMIVAWGSNEYGQCDVPGPNQDFIAIAGGMWHSLALRADGSVVAWGGNTSGQCDVPGQDETYTAVAAGAFHSLALRADGSIAAWGDNSSGQCGVPEPNTGYTAIAAGFSNSIGLKGDGNITCWGDNTFGQCTMPGPNLSFAMIGTGAEADHNIALLSNGTLVVWGVDQAHLYGQEIPPEPDACYVDVSRGWYHNIALREDGVIVCFGWNNRGQCDVPGPNSDFVKVGAGAVHSIGLKSNGSVVSWGENWDSTPVPNEGFTDIAAGTHHNLAIRPGPSISGIKPGSGVKGTWVKITNLSGNRFAPGAKVFLSREGYREIAVPNPDITPTRISGMFSLACAAEGSWDVI
ncbi:MAG: hypothetical protein LUQ25_08715, partial [Methanoregulaceae archaeon]|nr:hypothetical protein [Methanoregulaceae archaeon]